MDNIFEGQTAIISGGLGDIGRAVALKFAARGAKISLGDIKPKTEAGAFLEQLKKHTQCMYHQVDISDAEAVRKWVDLTGKELDTPEIIIANAATVTAARIHEITPDQWDKELSVNINGAFYLTQYATEKLVALKRPGCVVFTGSWAADTVHLHIPAYCVSKAGLRMLCRCMALELAPHHIRVNEIAPGYVNAGLTAQLWKENPGQYEIDKERVPIKEVMSEEDVAEQIVYLCHPANKHMIGNTLLMDGGLSLKCY